MLAEDKLAFASMGSVDPLAPTRKQFIQEYVRRRLRAERDAHKGRGGTERLAEALHSTSAHISNMLKHPPERNPGEELSRRAAAHWGISYAELERLACGADPELAPGTTTPPPPTLDELRAIIREEIAVAIRDALSPPRRERPRAAAPTKQRRRS